MIPRILNYVWIGERDLPEPDRTYVEGWSKACPGWEIRRWGLDDVKDVDCRFLRETLAAKKWVFACDWLRLYALSKTGGFYLDTDVELKSSLEPFRDNDLCMGLNESGYPQTALIGSVPGQREILELLEETSSRKFILGPGIYDETANNSVFMEMFKRKGIDLKALGQDAETEVSPGVKFYPASVLCRPKGSLPNVAWHHAAGYWLEPYRRKSAVDLPFSLRLVRMKKRKKIAKKTDALNLLADERLIASANFGRMVFALVRRI